MEEAGGSNPPKPIWRFTRFLVFCIIGQLPPVFSEFSSIKFTTIRLDCRSRGVRVVSSTKRYEVPQNMCIFDRAVPRIESPDWNNMVDFDPSSEFFLVILVRDSADDTREVVPPQHPAPLSVPDAAVHFSPVRDSCNVLSPTRHRTVLRVV